MDIQSALAFSDFRETLKNVTKLNSGDEVFIGKVIYEFSGKTISETLKVYLKLVTANQDLHKIELEEGKTINSKLVHVDFTADYQKYTLSSEGFLNISGNSGRIGKYKVTIIEA